MHIPAAKRTADGKSSLVINSVAFDPRIEFDPRPRSVLIVGLISACRACLARYMLREMCVPRKLLMFHPDFARIRARFVCDSLLLSIQFSIDSR